jgi:hypothetical protein
VNWDERSFPNRPYVVTGASSAPWAFAGTGLRDGAAFGNYGIEIDATTSESPPGIQILAEIPNDFRPASRHR